MRVAALILSLATAIPVPGARAGSSVSFAPSQLIQIEAGEGHYYLWAIVSGAPVSLGPFNIGNDGVTPVDPGTFQPIGAFTTAADLSLASALWVSVEAETSASLVPSNHHVLAGDVQNRYCELRPDNPDALGIDFTGVAGGFILDTPTTIAIADSASGIWFLQPGVGGPDLPGLDIPPLPEGWDYESWVTDADSGDPIPMSMGAFDDPNGPDIICGGCGNENPAPPFPGQDFIHAWQNQPILPNFEKGRWTVIISIEPKPNTGPSPFHSLEPLRTFAIQPAPRRVFQSLTNTANAFPSATATITITTAARPTSWGTIKRLYR